MSRQTIRHRSLIPLAMVTLGMLLVCIPGWSAILNPTITITNDVNGDGIAGIGDSLTFSCRSTNVTAGVTPYVELSALGNSRFYLPNIVSNWYSAIFSLNAARALDNGTFGPNFWDDDGPSGPGNTVSIDVQPPTSLLGITLDSSAATGVGGVYKYGDHLKFTITFTDADATAAPARIEVYADLTNLGLGTNVRLNSTAPGTGIYTFDQLLPAGREKIGDTFSILAIDDAGNRKTFASAISYDTRAPEFQSCTLTNLSGGAYVRPGDQVKVTAVVRNYDNDRLYASQSVLLPGGEEEMTKISGSTVGDPATYEFITVAASGTNLDSNFVRFSVRGVDDAGNEFTRYTNALAFDTIPPGFADANVFIQEKGGVMDGNTAIIGDTLYFFGNLSQVFSDVTLTVDLSAIGGVSNQIMELAPASTSFKLYYDVHQYTSENNIPRAFTVKAYDKANNVVYQYTMPVIYVDNLPPTISGGQLQKVTTGGGTAKLNDVIGVQANVSNLDNGAVWTDLCQVGGAASSTLSPNGGTTYRIEHTVTTPGGTCTPIDTSKSYRIYAYDDAGNTVFTDTNTYPIDNDPPVITAATYTVSPALSATHPWVKVGDTVTFLVSLANSGTTPHDGETVSMNLTALGGTSNQALTYDGVGTFTHQLVVTSGALNTDTAFTAVAKDNAGNTDSRGIMVHVDNSPCTVGPMTVNFLTDMTKAGAVNIGDRLEFIIPVSEPDLGTCTIDLSLVGSVSTSVMNYDTVLSRYYLILDTATATVENSAYVFRAQVSDKAGNTMNSLSGTFEVDCVPPILNYASATFQNLVGAATTANIGDKITITASIDPVRLDGGTPIVNLTAIGGNGAQILYDDGAHDDGGPSDGLYGFTQTIAAGTTDGASASFIVQITDNCGNRTSRTTEAYFIDNKPLAFGTCVAAQTYDNNGNTVVDLDGFFTTYPQYATDVVMLTIKMTGAATDYGQLTVDLRPLGYSDTARRIDVTTTDVGGWTAVASFSPIPGTTNRVNTTFQLSLSDANGNIVTATTTPTLLVDNLPPTIQVYPISWVLDNGRQNEANEGDVIQFKVRCNNHDGILPQLDLAALYLDNGLPTPSPIFFTTGGPNEYTLNWTVPAGLGTLASLPLLIYDQSGNQAVGYTNVIRFLSKSPSIAAFPASRCDLASDAVPINVPNKIVNPGDQVKITCTLTSAYNLTNFPPATVLVDIRSLTNSAADDWTSSIYDGNSKTFWIPLGYRAAVGSGGPFIYDQVFTASAAKADAFPASFAVKVVHPDTNAIVTASATIECDPADQFGIDTQVPYFSQAALFLIDDTGDNLATNTAQIGDTLRAWAVIEDFPDPASVTAAIWVGGIEVYRTPLTQIFETKEWEATFTIGTGTVSEWLACNAAGGNAQVRFYASDDADNLGSKTITSNMTIDNDPPVILGGQIFIQPGGTSPAQNPTSWTANIGDGYAATDLQGDNLNNDAIVASLTVSNSLDLTGRGMAWIDLSPILGTSTLKMNVTGSRAQSPKFELATPTIEFASYTLNLFVRDPSGNKAVYPVVVAVDTTRPFLTYAFYDGAILTMQFNETLHIESGGTGFDQTKVRIGRTMDHKAPWFAANIATLSVDDGVLEYADTDVVRIQLASVTKAIISDWGSSSLYISIGHDNQAGGWEDPTAPQSARQPIARDVAGNWLKPSPLFLATQSVIVTTTYTNRPHLVGGYYRADNPTDAQYLILNFDKDMDITTISTDTLDALAIWKNRGSPDDTFASRYRFYWSAAHDYVLPRVTELSTQVRLQLSQEAQDWIALNYGKNGTQINFQVDDNTPPLIRDYQGNRVVPIPYFNATPATLIPLQAGFSIQKNSRLDLTGTLASMPILTMNFQGAADARRARLYSDGYSADKYSIILNTNTPVDLSRIYIYQRADGTGGYFPLNTSMVDYTLFKTLNPDFASTSVRIPLKTEALQIMLSWGSTEFYLAATAGAFKDLWGNDSLRFPETGTTAEKIPVVDFPTVFTRATIRTLAMAPLIDVSRHELDNINQHLLKGFDPGLLTYEVTFNTATISGDVAVPIDRSLVPELEFISQVDNTVIDVASFVGWFDHRMGSEIKTGARFVNLRDFSDGTGNRYQREPCYVRVKNFRHIYWTSLISPEEASQTYNLIHKDESALGFNTLASMTPTLDNRDPVVATFTPMGVIPITPAGSAIFKVTFDEPMDADRGVYPTLALKQGSVAVMTFTCTGMEGDRTFVYSNNAAFNESTAQGDAYYEVTGGRDQATNPHLTTTSAQPVTIRSKGPVITLVNLETMQGTVDPTKILNGQPYSSVVWPNVATITVTLDGSGIATPSVVKFYEGVTVVASLAMQPLTGSALTYYARWDDFLLAHPTTPRTLELRFFDQQGNEGSKRGSVIYDTQPPTVTSWNFGNVLSYGGKAYFSPAVKGFVKIDVGGPLSGQVLRIAMSDQTITTPATTAIALNQAGTIYSVSWNGVSPVSNSVIDEGEYTLSIVDAAGNLGVGTRATATLVLDKTPPSDLSIIAQNSDGVTVTRCNPTVSSLTFRVTTLDTSLGGGRSLVRIKQGGVTIRDLYLADAGGTAPNIDLTTVWDGKNSVGVLVEDGDYQIYVLDLAENSYDPGLTITVVTSPFRVTAATQVDKYSARVTFSHDVISTAQVGNFELTSALSASPVIANSITVSGKEVTLTFGTPFTHNTLYTITAVTGLESADGAQVQSGYNKGQFTADTQAPLISNYTFEGITSQKEVNIVYDEQVTATSATSIGNYTLQSSTGTIVISAITMRPDNKSVKITSLVNLAEGQNYTISASGVEDLYKNRSSGATTRVTFAGQDVTPPVVTVSVFSNPANEYDLSVVVRGNEAFGAAPTATITQSGGSAVTITLNAGPTPLLYIGGTTLDKNRQGVATIQVVGKDVKGNSTTTTVTFSIAVVNASLRAEVRSSDEKFAAVFEAGTLAKDSLVGVYPVTVAPAAPAAGIQAGLRSDALGRADASLVRAVRLSTGESLNEELAPVALGYDLSIPAGRLQGPIDLRLALPAGGLPAGAGLFRLAANGSWQMVGAFADQNVLTARVAEGGTYALLRDSMAPRVSFLTQLDPARPLREDRPLFSWQLTELGSGLAADGVKVVLDNAEEAGVLSADGSTLTFVPAAPLVGGDHVIALKARDNAGNETVTAAVRFQVLPPLAIHEIVQFPNPAASRVTLRVSTNRALDPDSFEVTIYDTAGQRVANTGDLNITSRLVGGRLVQDLAWDLRNRSGKAVANGVYFAKIAVRDPDNWEKKTKITHKLAVLR
ncbi:MAG: Ig-like domain-containing protein [Candidatus Riflebacteria bacterium]|nr:Ig-like domain-containing protein [Candidatus Riflebacteria bacterium]